jgi:SAM-dependent methyltransferase
MASVDGEVEKLNRSLYLSPRIVSEYGDKHFKRQLMPSELRILEEFSDIFCNQPILDIGVGGGRTTPHLLAVSDKYTGIDYSESMVAHCRARFPGIDFRKCNARDLSPFAEAQFSVAFFSFNGIDHATTDERSTILCEIRRVLRPGGIFVFSSHNLLCSRRTPRDFPLIRKGGRVSENLVTIFNFFRNRINYWRRRHLEWHGEGHAMVVDQAHFFRLLLYYITPQRQLEQLQGAGFDEVRMYGVDGREVTVDEPARDPWIYYVARNPAG